MGGEKLPLEVDFEQLGAPFMLTCRAAQPLLAFPKTCKLAYLEAAQFIYASNTFQIPDLTSYVCFQRLLPANSFQAIQSIHMKWESPICCELFGYERYGFIPYDISSWNQTWQEISGIKGLKYVRVDMTSIDPISKYGADYEDLLFSPLEAVQGVKYMDVGVDWVADRGKKRPFTVRSLPHPKDLRLWRD
ncbi:uncharacterized protein K460DRAFT_370513, partial [Cucurbitaria berberidis CBS 394.84]